MMIGPFYLLLSAAAIFFWKIDPQLCTTEACLSLPGLLGRSWYLWGALFYAVAGFLCLRFPKNRGTGAFLASGAVFHAGLIWYGYTITGSVCPVCWKFAVMSVLLTAAYFVLPERKPRWASYVSSVPARALVVVAFALLLVNPQIEQPLSVTGRVAESEPAVGTVQKAAPVLSAAEASSCYLQVTTPDGRGLCLDLQLRPALFVAVWCPHCDEVLREVAKMEPEKRPYLVVTYLQDGDIEKVKDKLAKNGLSTEAYYMAEKPPTGIQGVPALARWDGELKYVEGASIIKAQLQERDVRQDGRGTQ